MLKCLGLKPCVNKDSITSSSSLGLIMCCLMGSSPKYYTDINAYLNYSLLIFWLLNIGLLSSLEYGRDLICTVELKSDAIKHLYELIILLAYLIRYS